MDNFFQASFLVLTLMAVFLVLNDLIRDYEYSGANRSSVHVLNIFQSYVKKFNKSYTDSEFLKRLKHFEHNKGTNGGLNVLWHFLPANRKFKALQSVGTKVEDSLEEISRLNEIHGAKVFGLTKFSDLSDDEFRRIKHSGLRKEPCHTQYKLCNDIHPSIIHKKIVQEYPEMPKKIDWRVKGVVFPVLDQKLCLGCWAFSIVGVMESRSAIYGKAKIRRSIQELLDCSELNKGCSKGDIRNALHYLCSGNHAVVKEDEYPLTLKDESCQLPKDHIPEGLRIAEFTNNCYINDTISKDNIILTEVAFHGPVVAAVNSAPLRNYINGVIKTACIGTWNSIDHVVQIVGYDLTADIPHYIIRNSWGSDYGDQGYLKIAIGGNVCGIASNIAYFTVV